MVIGGMVWVNLVHLRQIWYILGKFDTPRVNFVHIGYSSPTSSTFEGLLKGIVF